MALNLLNKVDAYKQRFSTEKHISLTMITASGDQRETLGPKN